MNQVQNACIEKEKKIKKRRIRHGRIKEAKVNKNCPKFILGFCWHDFQSQIMELASLAQKEYLSESFDLTRKWINGGCRDRLNLKNLTLLFGNGTTEYEKRRNHTNSKLLYYFLKENAFDIIWKNRRIEKPLSYLICLQKFTGRLPNPSLVYKLQFK